MTPSAQRWTAADAYFEIALLGLLGSGYLAVLGSGYLDTTTAVATAAGLLVRALYVLGWVRFDISENAVTRWTVAYIAFYPLDYMYLSRDFLTATVHLVFFLAVVKVLTASSERDFFYVKIIAFLELLAASVLSSSANYFLFLALFLFFGVGTFTASEIRRSAARTDFVVRSGQRNLNWRLLGVTVFAVGGILTLTASLFFLLPRTARAAFQRLVPQRYHVPGFSNEVTLGQIGELKMRNSAVMHARILTGNEMAPYGLKWRGAALTQFDGKRWFNETNSTEVMRVEAGVLRVSSLEDTLRRARRISYEVAMQESTSDALFLAGSPETIQIAVPLVIRTPANTFRLFGPADQLRYRVYALLETGGDPKYTGRPMSTEERMINLRLPPLDGRIGELAKRIAAGSESDFDKTHALEAYLRRAYPYTTELPQVETADPVADFLFRRKKGHCEYFASSLAVMLRSIGIPARIATGFQSGIFNPLSGWYLIRASDAHSWVEVWLKGRGWTTFDPTPPDPNPAGQTLSMRLQLYADALQVFWQDWVLSYDIERQLNLAARVEQSSRSFQLRWLERAAADWAVQAKHGLEAAKRKAWLVTAAAGVFAALFFFGPALVRYARLVVRVHRVRRGQASASDATLLYRRMLSILRQRGIEKPAWITPSEFAGTVKDPQAAALVGKFTDTYYALRFGNDHAAAPRLVALLDELQRASIVKRN
ncbi:MAG: DUF3488 domain-containing protein [Bryobacterales bacterium]|nr:DUF3488 domain-containing protein [Bryobacterales bacterium]